MEIHLSLVGAAGMALVAASACGGTVNAPQSPAAAAGSESSTPSAASGSPTSAAASVPAEGGGPLDAKMVPDGHGWSCHAADLAPLYCDRDQAACEDHRSHLNADKPACSAMQKVSCFTGAIGFWCAASQEDCLGARQTAVGMTAGMNADEAAQKVADAKFSGCAALD